MTALYVEIDQFAADWTRELMADGLIAPGDVTTTSLEDILPHDLARYTQVHFCAGISVWSLALRIAGWPDDRQIWTASLPCQPFSAAGKSGGFADERHLWPAFFHLVTACRPAALMGEQVASLDGLGWLDLVQADLEGADYTSGAVDLCAAGVGAPHIRQRLWWFGKDRLADASRVGQWTGFCGDDAAELRGLVAADGGAISNLAHADEGRQRAFDHQPGEPGRCEAAPGYANASGGLGGVAITDPAERRPDGAGGHDSDRADAGRAQGAGDLKGRGELIGVANPDLDGLQPRRLPERQRRQKQASMEQPGPGAGGDRPGPVNGLWAAADWLRCRDGKWRPVEPGTFPLVNAGALRNRVAELRGAGNAINLAAAVVVIESVTPEFGPWPLDDSVKRRHN